MDNAECERWAELMGNGNKVEFLVAICALVTSVMAVYMAWDQGRVMRAQQHGAVYPVVQIEGFVSSTAETDSMGLRLTNSGVGPALIERVQMLKDGQPIKSLTPYMDLFPSGYVQSWSTLIGRAVAPGDEVVPLRADWASDVVTFEQRNSIADAWGELDVELCYCSVFNKCWIARGLQMGSSMSPAEPVKECQRSDVDIFEAAAAYTPSPDIEPSEEVE